MEFSYPSDSTPQHPTEIHSNYGNHCYHISDGDQKPVKLNVFNGTPTFTDDSSTVHMTLRTAGSNGIICVN